MDWLKNLDLARWWIMAIAVGVVITTAALAVKDRSFAIVGLGIVAVGFGEWFNHPKEMMIYRTGTLTSYERKNRAVGVALVVIGLLLVLVGTVRLLAPQVY